MMEICVNASSGTYYCPGWYLFVLPSLCLYVGVLLILLVLNLIGYSVFRKWHLPFQSLTASSLHDFAFGHSKAGRFMIVVVFHLSIASFFSYVVEVNGTNLLQFYESKQQQQNPTWSPSAVFIIEVSINCLFALHFLIRVSAASNKLQFWLSWETIVDVATLPTYVMYFVLQQYWSGLRFFRAMYLIKIPNILQIVGVLKDSRVVQFFRLLFAFITLWLVSAGMVHMFENNGDPWANYFNGQTLTYFECIYFLIITSSTVGYGDITCITTLGRMFDVTFVFIGLGMFANLLPEVLQLLQMLSPYNGRLRLPLGVRHILVVGNVSSDSAIKFYVAFKKESRGKKIAIVFLHPNSPSVTLESLLKSKKNLYYFRGNELDASDLNRVDVAEAEACVILADKHAANPEEEDSANLMRAIALKNQNGRTRVLIELLLVRMKCHLINIPCWNAQDAAVCLDEFRMGTLAQNCWAPGFATLLSLLLTTFSARKRTRFEKYTQMDLEEIYLRGTSFKIHGVPLSPDFAGMSFAEAAELCYQQSKLLLIAVKSSVSKEKLVLLNPGKQYLIKSGDQAFFIASSADNCDWAKRYCKVCNQKNNTSGRASSHCECGRSENRRSVQVSETPVTTIRNRTFSENETETQMVSSEPSEMQVTAFAGPDASDDSLPKFDSTGTVYWRPKQAIGEAVLSLQQAKARNFRKHVVVCVFTQENSPPLGLRNLVVPLRSSDRLLEELKAIVLIGNLAYLEREWHQIDTFPNLFILPGSALDRTLLRSVNVQLCDMCVILSTKADGGNRIFTDKYSILCYLSIKSMRLEVEGHGDLASRAPDEVLSDTSENLVSVESFTSDKFVTASRKANHIPVIADITNPENLLILDKGSSHDKNTSFVNMRPFESGDAFTADMLDSVISASYFNPDVLTLVRELVNGGRTPEADLVHSEGLEFTEGDACSVRKGRQRSRACLSHFTMTELQFLSNSGTYAEMFLGVLRQFGRVCLGVCRQHNDASPTQRYVLLNPPGSFPLQPTDIIICLLPPHLQ